MRKEELELGSQDLSAAGAVRDESNFEIPPKSKIQNPQPSFGTRSSLDPDVKRMRWRCRRGLLELDIVLGRFVEQHYANLEEDERRVFDAFLDMPDNSLWDMIGGKLEATLGEHQALLEKIRAS